MRRKSRAILDGAKNILWALVFAVALWFVMAQSEQTTRDDIDAVLNVIPPPGANVNYFTARNQPPTARIKVVGPRTIVNDMEGVVQAVNEIPANTDMGGRSLFVRDFKFNLPAGVVPVKSAITEEIKIELALKKEDELAVEPNLDRELPEGWEIEPDGVKVEPKFVAASGSAEDMARNPKLTTQPLSLRKMLERSGFDKTSDKPLEVEQKVLVAPPEGAGLNILDRRPVTVRVRVKPKDRPREIPFVPAFHFPGLVFPGLPYKLKPALANQDVVKVLVSGPELALRDAQIEATKAKFVVYAEPLGEDLGPKWKLELGKYYNFQVHVLPPPGIRVISFDDKIKIAVEAMDVEVTPGGGPK